jgi:hypothetical protein
MRLCKLKQFRSLVYAFGSEPTVRTLRAHIDAGKIPGGRREHSGLYYVDLDEYDRATRLTANLEEKRQRLAKSPELEGLI